MLNNLKIKTKNFLNGLIIAIAGTLTVVMAIVSTMFLDENYNKIIKIDNLILTNQKLISTNEQMVNNINRIIIQNQKIDQNLNQGQLFETWNNSFKNSFIHSSLPQDINNNIHIINEKSKEL